LAAHRTKSAESANAARSRDAWKRMANLFCAAMENLHDRLSRYIL
jgi:hypothetical protein